MLTYNLTFYELLFRENAGQTFGVSGSVICSETINILLSLREVTEVLFYFSILLMRVAAALQVSLQTVYAVEDSIKHNAMLPASGKERPRNKSKISDMSESTKMEVRNAIYNMNKEIFRNACYIFKNMLQVKEIVHRHSFLGNIIERCKF